MNTILRPLLGVVIFVGAGQAPARGTEPAAATAGKVLLLQNERALEGDIERVGDQYRIRRTAGEAWVPVFWPAAPPPEPGTPA